jgi:hypothetical protein
MHQRRPADAVGHGAAQERVPVRPEEDRLEALRADPQREQVAVHRLHDARHRGMGAVELHPHPAPLGHVGHDAGDLDPAVVAPAGDGAIADPARDAVGALQAVLDLGGLAAAQAVVERDVGGAVVRMDRRVPVGHLRVGLRAAQQALRARALEDLADRPVRQHLREVDVFPEHVEQACEAVALLRQTRLGVPVRE